MTANHGASETRLAIQRKIRRMLKKVDKDPICVACLGDLYDWISRQTERAGYAPGGLGNKLTRPTTKKSQAVKA